MIKKFINLIFNGIAVITLYAICTMTLTLLLKFTNYHPKQIEYFLYFGMGILIYYPATYIFNHGNKK